jgi:hypothetical protein
LGGIADGVVVAVVVVVVVVGVVVVVACGVVVIQQCSAYTATHDEIIKIEIMVLSFVVVIVC